MTVVTGVGAWCAAGRGVGALVEAAIARRPCFDAPAPYPTEGLLQPRAGFIPDLDRARPVSALLEAVVQEALAEAGLGRVAAGLIVGTSSGDISGPWSERCAAGEPTEEPRSSPTHRLAEHLGIIGPTATVSLACASGTAAIELALGWLREARVDCVIVAGVDALCPFIHAGFNGLRALASDRPRPFQAERDGLLLGEGAAALVLERAESAASRGAHVLAHVLGAGLGGDAFHITAPHRSGRGAARAITSAVADAGLGPDDIDLLSAHGTATPFNDAMESQALRTVFGTRPLAVHALKGCIGHTLGAAGALEAALMVATLRDNLTLPTVESPAPDCPIAVAPSRAPRRILSTSSAFGGANAAVVFGADPTPTARVSRPVAVTAEVRVELPAGDVDWRALWPDPPARFGRMDRFIRAVLVAIHQAGAELPRETGVVLATQHGCALADRLYYDQLLQDGAAYASRLRFMYTVPGAPVAEAAIQWDLQGPQCTLIGPPEHAEEVGHRWVREGRCPVALIIAADAPARDGPAHAWVRVFG